MAARICPECSAPVLGRIDKKFCSDQCRATNNNRHHRESNVYIREVNKVLRRNRLILDSLNPGGRVRVPASRLKEKGFDFRYHTDVSRTREGVYYYCYDQGYSAVGKNYFLLVLRSEDSI